MTTVPTRSVAPHAESDILSRAFCMALLVTGQIASSEGAVLEAIWGSEPDPVSDDTFILIAVIAALSSATESGGIDRAALSILPLELKRVLHLPLVVRQCFVLRTLVGFSLDACSHLLHMTLGQVDAALCEAVRRLAHANLTEIDSQMSGDQTCLYGQSDA